MVAGALAGLACAGLFAIVGVRVLLAQGQSPVDELEARVTAAQAENQRLRLNVARLESPARIVAEAKARLGMVPPAVVVYLPPLAQSPPADSPPADSPPADSPPADSQPAQSPAAQSPAAQSPAAQSPPASPAG